MKKITALSLAISLSASLQAGELAIGLSEHSAEFALTGQANSATQTRASWLHHEDNGDLITLGLHAENKQGATQLRLGGLLLAADYESEQGAGLALGAEIEHSFSQQLSFLAGAHYAPSVLSFSDLERSRMFRAELNYKIMPNAAIYAGYRNVEFDALNIDELELHEGAFAGLKLSF